MLNLTAEVDAKRIDGAKIRKLLGLAAPVLGIALPDPLATALALKRDERAVRDTWPSWLARLGKARTVLLWVEPRRDDDQEFFAALARELGKKAVLWCFHAMGMLTVDRLTGDAVQLLVTTHGLRDVDCKNTGFGYYARGYRRISGKLAEPVPLLDDGESENDSAALHPDVEARDKINRAKIRAAVSGAPQVSGQMMLDDMPPSDESHSVTERPSKKEKLKAGIGKQAGRASAAKPTAKKSASKGALKRKPFNKKKLRGKR